MKMYTDKYMSDTSFEMCLKAIEAGLNQQTFLVQYGPKMSHDLIRQHMVNRVPVYYGRVMYGNFNKSYVSKLMGVTDFENEVPLSGGAYVICGPVIGQYKGMLRDDVYVAHTWHANFESRNTSDYKLYHTPTGQFHLDMYRQRCVDMFAAINRVALIVGQKTGKTPVVRLPRIGLGAFISAINPKYLDDIIEANTYAIEHVWPKSNHDVKVIICEYDSNRFRSLNSSVIRTSQCDLFNIGSQNPDETMILVNAWDNRSYIGNGGASDPTIDGFMVSGVSAGKTFPNSSYTHNHFISSIRFV